jgi:hypothetical protein
MLRLIRVHCAPAQEELADLYYLLTFVVLICVGADKDSEKVLAKEVESWKGFEYAVRNSNAGLFNMMLRECLENEQ